MAVDLENEIRIYIPIGKYRGGEAGESVLTPVQVCTS